MKKLLKTSADGRKCLHPQCTCILSIYNNEAYCHVHREQMAKAVTPEAVTAHKVKVTV